MPSRRGTRLSMSRYNPTPTRTYKAFPRKDPGDICASHSRTEWYSAISLCSIVTRLSRRGTILQMHSRNPSVSACISLYSVWSCSTPTLCNYHAVSTAPVPSPVQFLWKYHSLRLIWQVTFFGCAHLRGTTISTFTRKVWLPWTCVCFSCLSRL